MSAAQNMNAYLNNHYEGMTPEKLIHMLYKGALSHITLAREGMLENDPKKRGEHLSKVISIISELNSSINPEINDETTQFLRGLYNSILTELPRVSITNDIKVLDLTKSYIEKLNDIWETQVLASRGKKQKMTKPTKSVSPISKGYGSGNANPPNSIFA